MIVAIVVKSKFTNTITTVVTVTEPPNFYRPLDNYEYTNTIPIVRNKDQWISSRPGVFSSLYSDSYALAVAVLGHSIRRANVSVPMILPYIESQVSPKALCIAKAVGWETHPVELIPPPHNGEGIAYHFRDQYTKLSIWSLGEELGLDSAVYLDADTLVLRNFEELFHFPWEFGASQDAFLPGNDKAFAGSFNAGVLVFRPSRSTFEDMKGKLETIKYPLEMAEQAFLNQYFGGKAVRLPYAYNANLAIKGRSDELWAEVKDDMRIIHYTLAKPFSGADQLVTPNELRQVTENNESNNAQYREEIRWWREALDGLIQEQGSVVMACY